MSHMITILLILLLLACAFLFLAKKAFYFRQQNKKLREKESEFMNKLVVEGKPKPDSKFQMGLMERQATGREPFRMKIMDNELDTSEIRSLIAEKIDGLSREKLQRLLNYLNDEQISEKRKYDRKDFFRIVDYTVGDRYYRDFIKDMSEGGIFIETSNEFSSGQKIITTFISPDHQKPFKIGGEIAHTQSNGIGVKFKIESQVQESILKKYVNMIQNQILHKS